MELELEELNSVENRKGDTSSRLGLAKGSPDKMSGDDAMAFDSDDKSLNGKDNIRSTSNNVKKLKFIVYRLLRKICLTV